MKTSNRHFDYCRPVQGRFKAIGKITYHLQNIFYKCVVNLHHLLNVKTVRNKYRISLVLIFKDEARFLDEWLCYHIEHGIEHFYLYQNNSTDNYTEVLAPYMEKGLITLVDWPEYPGQYSAYMHWYENFRNETDWAGFIDIDEFLCPLNDDDMFSVLQRFERYPVVLIYWKLFGTSGLMKHNDDKLVIEQYFICRKNLFTEGKILYNTSFDIAKMPFSMHGCDALWKGLKIPPVNTFGQFVISDRHEMNRSGDAVVQLNHYWSKAYDCWQKKFEKGSIEKGIKWKNYEFFNRLEMRCDSSDFSISRFIVRTYLKIKEFKHLTSY